MTMKPMRHRFVVSLVATAALLALVSCEPTVISGGRLVESIIISADGGSAAISELGGTLQLVAEVLPSSAANKSLRWSVISGGLYANVSETGLVMALGNGTATIRARAQDGSGVYGEINVTISGQPADGTLTFSLTSGGTSINETQPAYYIISTSELFSNSSQTLAVKRTTEGSVSQALPPGSYYLRAFNDLDNNGNLDEGEPFTAAADYRSGPQLIFSPMEIIISSGEVVVIDLDTLPVLGSTESWTWPANPGTLKVNLGYSGSGITVDDMHRLFLGISTNGDLTKRSFYIADIGIEENDREVLAILSAGTYYLSSFLDAGANANHVSPVPTIGDPAQVYNRKAFAPGEGIDFYANPVVILDRSPYIMGLLNGPYEWATISLDHEIIME